MKKNKKIDKLITTLAKNVISTNPKESNPNWPMPKVDGFECYLRIAPLYYKKFLWLLDELRAKRISDKQIAKSFQYPSIIVRIAYLLVLKNLTGLSKEELTRIAEETSLLISYLSGDPYCQKRKHLLLSNNELKQELRNKKVKFTIVNRLKQAEKNNLIKIYSQLSAKLFLLTESIYMEAHNVGHEFHGPYDAGNGNYLLIKDYHYLRPDFWPEIKNLGFDQIKIFLVYPKKIKTEIDFSNRLYTSGFIYSQMTACGIEMEGKFVNQNEILKIIEQLDKVLNRIIIHCSKMSKKEILEKFVLYRFYMFKPLYDLLGKSWKPSKSNLEKMTGPRRLIPSEKYYLEQFSKIRRNIKDWKRAYDPNITLSEITK